MIIEPNIVFELFGKYIAIVGATRDGRHSEGNIRFVDPVRCIHRDCQALSIVSAAEDLRGGTMVNDQKWRTSVPSATFVPSEGALMKFLTTGLYSPWGIKKDASCTEF